ncbi:DASH family cryptochrome [Persicitalea sp.]|uniref:DASH family cryptochrome n=1 Tax=Persicitalea sp. TaxID=3100273 RepID=UPI003593DE68
MAKKVLYWHRSDLRLHDNECLARACSEDNEALPVYIYDERHYQMLDLGFRKTSHLRYRYLQDTLHDLRENYQKIGGDLLIRHGKPEEILPQLIAKYECDELIFQKEIMSEETEVESLLTEELKSQPCKITPIWGRTLYHIDDIPFEPAEVPLTSKTFRINTSKATQPRALFPIPERIDVIPLEDYGKLDWRPEIGFTDEELATDYDADAFPAGETAALERLRYYTFDSELLTNYKWTRNRSLGLDYSSKFSPYLAHGSLSPRQIYHTVKDYEDKVKKNRSTWWLVFEVVWRDYFSFLGLRFGDRVFYSGGYKGAKTDWKEDYDLFDRWKYGKTGIPFVDAHMYQLSRTGFMSNRGRVNTASFFSRDYGVDWRWGAAWFESLLLDYDVCSNWFNWNTQALHMYYTNPLHQSLKYDKATEYISSELDYLNKLPLAYRHAPWLLSDDELEELGIPRYKRPEEIYKKWTRSINNIQKLIDAKTETITDNQ